MHYGRDMLAVSLSLFVKGFGCRPLTAVRHTLAAGVQRPPRADTAVGAGAAVSHVAFGVVASRGRGEDSMRIVGAPQEGHGCESGFAPRSSVAASWFGCGGRGGTASSSRARAMLSMRAPLANRP